MKIFKDYVEENDISHIQYDAKILENRFKSMFQLLQFNIDVKSLNKYLLMAYPDKPVTVDQTDELALEKALEA